MKKADNLDNAIWIANQMEEILEDTEQLVNEKIKALDYQKTINDLHAKIDELNKEIEQKNYSYQRALESLEQDLSMKIEDTQIIADNVLDKKITEIIEENILELKDELEILSKKTRQKQLDFQKTVKKEQEEKFDHFTNTIERLLDEAAVEEKKAQNNQRFKDVYETINQNKEKEENHYQELRNRHESDLREQIDKIREIEKESNQLKENIENFGTDSFRYIEEHKKENNKNLDKLKSDFSNQLAKQENNFEEKIYKLSVDKIKEKQKDIEKRLKEVETINQNKLEKVEREQEKFIRTKIDMHVVKMEQLIEENRKQILKEAKDYMESRILRMKYALTIQSIQEEIAELKNRIHAVESEDNAENEDEKLRKKVELLVDNRIKAIVAHQKKAQQAKKKPQEKIKTVDDMLENRKMQVKTEHSLKTTTKQINNITKKKSQILNTGK